MVARERFELSSRAPEAPMLDHYTTGLQAFNKTSFQLLTLTFRCALRLSALSFSYTVAFLANPVLALAAPKRIHDWVFVVPVPCGTENFGGVIVAVVAVAVAAELFFTVVIHISFPSLHVFLAAKTSYA